MTTAPLSLPLYCGQFLRRGRFMAMTSAWILPSVPGIQPQDATVSGTPLSGSIRRSEAVPRFQASGNSHASWWTLLSPYAFILSAAHSLACLRFLEPVRRGPMSSQR